MISFDRGAINDSGPLALPMLRLGAFEHLVELFAAEEKGGWSAVGAMMTVLKIIPLFQ